MDAQVDKYVQQIHSLIGYAAEVESLVLKHHGLPLTDLQLADARLVGVSNPDKIRLATSFAFIEEDPRFTVLLDLGPALAGLTIGHAVILNAKQAINREVFLHESAHVAQYERLGISRFLQRYFAEIATFGYEAAPLELEAAALARTISKRGCMFE